MSQTKNPELSRLARSLDPSVVAIVYDGECPFCSAYTHRIQLKEAGKQVQLIDARTDETLARKIWDAGIDLDNEIVVLTDGRAFIGAGAMHALAELGQVRAALPGVAARLFHSHERGRKAYPLLRAARRLTLFLLGRTPMRPPR